MSRAFRYAKPSSIKCLRPEYAALGTERQKSCTTLLFVILFQTLMIFENNELSMNGQVISNRCYASAMKLSKPFSRN